jgi:chromosome segregation ATPase
MLDEYFISTFLEALTKKVNSDNANFILQKLGSGDINFMELLGEIGSKKEIQDLTEKLKSVEKSITDKNRVIDRLRGDKRTLVSKKRTLEDDLNHYISAIRYYEDTLESMGCRRDILRRKDLGKIFNEDEEDGWS